MRRIRFHRLPELLVRARTAEAFSLADFMAGLRGQDMVLTKVPDPGYRFAIPG
jgi:hypothetical protein